MALFEVGALAALVRAFEQAKEWRADAVLRLAGQGLTGGRETAALALSHRLPSMLLSRADVEAGGLMSYYIDFNPGWRRLATYVDRILKGAPPGELPVEYAADYRLVLNRRTAEALGLDSANAPRPRRRGDRMSNCFGASGCYGPPAATGAVS